MRSAARSYVLAGAALGSAVLLRLILDPLMGDTLPLVTLFGAVAIAVWLGGYRPAVVVTVLGYVACAYLFIQPRGSLGLNVAGNAVGLGRAQLGLAVQRRRPAGDRAARVGGRQLQPPVVGKLRRHAQRRADRRGLG